MNNELKLLRKCPKHIGGGGGGQGECEEQRIEVIV